jgi:hypothetical protein
LKNGCPPIDIWNFYEEMTIRVFRSGENSQIEKIGLEAAFLIGYTFD